MIQCNKVPAELGNALRVFGTDAAAVTETGSSLDQDRLCFFPRPRPVPSPSAMADLMILRVDSSDIQVSGVG